MGEQRLNPSGYKRRKDADGGCSFDVATCRGRAATPGPPEAESLRLPNGKGPLRALGAAAAFFQQPLSEPWTHWPGHEGNGRHGATPKASSAPRVKPGRRLRLIGVGIGLAVLLGSCTFSPEAARVRGEPGADPGNHGHPVDLLAPPDRFERIYYRIPYDGPAVASEDTSLS